MNNLAQIRSFTSSYNGLANVLVNQVQVGQPLTDGELIDDLNLRPERTNSYSALWDTGATNSVVTERVINECGLTPVGMIRVGTASGLSETAVFWTSLWLPNGSCIPRVKVSQGQLTGIDVLIGMDVINLGDFCVTNYNGKTVFSFRIPSLETVDYTKPVQHEVQVQPKIGRNQPCPCGSGKKYKYCHGKPK